MAEEKENSELETDEEAADGTEPKAKRLSGKKLVLILLPVLLLLSGGGVAFVFLKPDSGPKSVNEANAHKEAQPAIYYDLPQMLVNLNSTGRRVNFLKIVVSLELEHDAEIARLEHVLPRIIDNFQVYLRELRIEDLKGSAGMYRLREELLLRVNAAVQPVVVRDVLFREMLIQ